MSAQTIDAELLNKVVGGIDLGNVHGGPSQPTDGIACTPGDPLGQRAKNYFSNPSPGGGEGGHGSGGHPHLDPPINLERPGPWRPTMQGPFGQAPRIPMGRSDRRLKRRIRAL
jgi:hypothetical protein